uniref:Protein king tubby n=2 Tax=Lygus hesperus TaxID=30085 RepID=A0A0A9WRW3_LYGHE
MVLMEFLQHQEQHEWDQIQDNDTDVAVQDADTVAEVGVKEDGEKEQPKQLVDEVDAVHEEQELWQYRPHPRQLQTGPRNQFGRVSQRHIEYGVMVVLLILLVCSVTTNAFAKVLPFARIG